MTTILTGLFGIIASVITWALIKKHFNAQVIKTEAETKKTTAEATKIAAEAELLEMTNVTAVVKFWKECSIELLQKVDQLNHTCQKLSEEVGLLRAENFSLKEEMRHLTKAIDHSK